MKTYIPHKNFNFYKDHLGNNRLSYTLDPESQEIKILEENHYYPFGLKHESYVAEKRTVRYKEVNTSKREVKQALPDEMEFKYLYNFKEYQDELSLNWYDYGARKYDAALGRWMNIDTASDILEASSQYAYALNNPILYLDKDGELPILINGLVSSDNERANRRYWTEEILNTISNSGIPNPHTNKDNEFHFVDGDRWFSFKIDYIAGERGGIKKGHLWNGNNPIARYIAGYKSLTITEFKQILSKLERNSDGKIMEKIQIYTHSRGAAFGAGYTQRLLELINEYSDQFVDANHEIDFVYNMAPHQSNLINSPNGIRAFSHDHSKDFLSGNDMGGLVAAFTSDEKVEGKFGSHSIKSFNNDLKGFISAFLQGGTNQELIDNFVKTMHDKYNVTVTVQQ